jgi:hypothetical protein
LQHAALLTLGHRAQLMMAAATREAGPPDAALGLLTEAETGRAG